MLLPPKKAYFRKRNFFSVVLLWCCYDSQTDMRLVEDRLRDFIDCIVDYNMCAVAFDFRFAFIVIYFFKDQHFFIVM